jgi:YHS domain-containing protein
MKKLDRVLAVISVAVISVAFYIADTPTLFAQNVTAQDEKADAAGKLNLDSDGVILLGSDVVAYFKEGKPVLGVPPYTTTYHGATYLFASAANKAEFDKDPEKYVPQYGAFCAYGLSLGVLCTPEGPASFIVYKGKLYVCGNQGALKSFKSDIDKNIESANRNWQQLNGS